MHLLTAVELLMHTLWNVHRYEEVLELTKDRYAVIIPAFEAYQLKYAVAAAEGKSCTQPVSLRLNLKFWSLALTSELPCTTCPLVRQLGSWGHSICRRVGSSNASASSTQL